MSSRRLAIHSTRPALRWRKCLTSHDVRREGTRKGFAEGSNSGKSLDQTVQACARLLSHGRKLDAHSFAGLAKAHQCAGAHVAARDFKNQLNYIAGLGRLDASNPALPGRCVWALVPPERAVSSSSLQKAVVKGRSAPQREMVDEVDPPLAQRGT